MIDNILWFLSLAPSALVYNYTLACLLDVPRKKTYAALLSFLSLSFSAFCHVCPVLPERQYINTGVQLLLIFGGAFVFGRMTKRLCLLASAIITVVIFLPELAGIYFYLHLSSDPQDPSDYLALLSHPSALLFLRLFYFVLVSLLCVLTLRLWDRFIKKTRLDILHYYLLFPLSQAILLVISVLFIERHAKGAVSTGIPWPYFWRSCSVSWPMFSSSVPCISSWKKLPPRNGPGGSTIFWSSRSFIMSSTKPI